MATPGAAAVEGSMSASTRYARRYAKTKSESSVFAAGERAQDPQRQLAAGRRKPPPRIEQLRVARVGVAIVVRGVGQPGRGAAPAVGDQVAERHAQAGADPAQHVQREGLLRGLVARQRGRLDRDRLRQLLLGPVAILAQLAHARAD